MYCLAQKGFAPGSIVVGNSVQSLGVVGSISSGLRTVAGGEIDNLTKLIVEGRHAAIDRLEKEATDQHADGVTGVSSDLKNLGGFKEFFAIGSTVKGSGADVPFFSTACSGQDLFCQIDAGYEPRHFVIGNVAYALGIGRGIAGGLKILGRPCRGAGRGGGGGPEVPAPPRRGQGILEYVQPHPPPRAGAAGGRGGRT